MKSRIKRFILQIKENIIAEQSRLIVWAPFLFACGIASYYALPFEPNYWLSLGIIEAVFVLFYILRYKGLHLLFVGILIYLFGFINVQLQTIYAARKVDFPTEKQVLYLKGQITEISQNSKGKVRLLLDNVSDFDKKRLGKYRITLNSKESNLKINQCVEMVATVFPPTRIPLLNGYQLDRKYFYNGISSTGYANSEVFAIDCATDIPTSTFSTRLNAIRKEITDDIGNVLPADVAGVADSVLIGEQTLISEDVLNNYRDSGLAHFLSVSGLHLGAIAGLVFFVLRFLIALIPQIALRYDSKKISAVGAIIFSAIYLLISGMAVPAQRAFIMTSVVLLGLIFNRQAISMRMVSFAALAVLIISPEALVSVSFQMSFSAVVALIAFYERYAEKLASWNSTQNIFKKIILYFVGIVICDFVASIATTPFAIYHFHRVSVYTSFGNLLAGPLIGFWLMPMILVCLIALPLGVLLYPLKVLGYGIGLLNKITAYVSSLPNSVAYIDSLPFWGFILIIVGGFWLCVWQLSWRKWGLVLIIIGCMPMFYSPKPDVVYAPNGVGIAVRNNQEEMVLLPYKIDGLAKRVWQENLHLKPLDTETQHKLNNMILGKTGSLENIYLQCTEKQCIYKEKIEFSSNGEIKVNKNKVETTTGGYIYISDKRTKIVPFYNHRICRLWQNCNQINKE